MRGPSIMFMGALGALAVACGGSSTTGAHDGGAGTGAAAGAAGAGGSGATSGSGGSGATGGSSGASGSGGTSGSAGSSGSGGASGSSGASGTGGSGGSDGGSAPSGKIDLLFMIDNSASMSDKQSVLAESVGALVSRLVNPICVAPDGTPGATPSSPDAPCAAGTSREFLPVADIHVGVISSSLGGHGATICDPGWGQYNPTQDEHAHLIGKTRQGVQSYNNTGFLAWDPGAKDTPPGASNAAAFTQDFADMVTAAGEIGCGFEAQLEAWYRFLIDPDPPDTISKGASGTTEASGTDVELLAERAAFLRADSLLSIVMITDENDCSVADAGLGWLVGYDNNLPRPTSACAQNPNDKCCHSCGVSDPAGCAHDPICDSSPTLAYAEDSLNLRCFDQKRRFGIATDPSHPEAGLLYPTQRYSNALKRAVICPQHPDLACGPSDTGVANPIYSDLSGSGVTPRGPDQVFLTGIVGVPWQDIATAATLGDASRLQYMTAQQLAAAGRWDVIVGDPASYTQPTDPMMHESIDPRTGTNPITSDPVAPTSAGPLANPINGHEFTIASRDDLQYACIFRLATPKDCTNTGVPCDCATGIAGDKPLCQDPATGQPAATPTQFFAKGYPGLRELEVLKEVGDNAIVASICPKITDATNPDHGYNPALGAIVERIKAGLY